MIYLAALFYVTCIRCFCNTAYQLNDISTLYHDDYSARYLFDLGRTVPRSILAGKLCRASASPSSEPRASS